ncbi:MAG: type II toxin-antitoxin system RelE/ParE family toxin [Magnetococcales bacterium]|nr:type II toxin-antitoxin system RelE/ParE family toxin [Magnetococcales bacterium]
MSDNQYKDLQKVLVQNPELGVIIRGGGGIRKLRWQSTKHGKGKRGGVRTIYYFHVQNTQIYFLTLYRKGEVSDLTKNELNMLRKLVLRWNDG